MNRNECKSHIEAHSHRYDWVFCRKSVVVFFLFLNINYDFDGHQIFLAEMVLMSEKASLS